MNNKVATILVVVGIVCLSKVCTAQQCYVLAAKKNCEDLYGPLQAEDDWCNDETPYCDGFECNNLVAIYFNRDGDWQTDRQQVTEVTNQGEDGVNDPHWCIAYHDCGDCRLINNEIRCEVEIVAVYEDIVDDWTLTVPCSLNEDGENIGP